MTKTIACLACKENRRLVRVGDADAAVLTSEPEKDGPYRAGRFSRVCCDSAREFCEIPGEAGDIPAI